MTYDNEITYNPKQTQKSLNTKNFQNTQKKKTQNYQQYIKTTYDIFA